MLALKQNDSIMDAVAISGNKTYTTLYDVIDAVAMAIGPGEERLLGTVVMQLLDDCRARSEFDLRNGPATTKGGNRHLYLYRREES